MDHHPTDVRKSARPSLTRSSHVHTAHPESPGGRLRRTERLAFEITTDWIYSASRSQAHSPAQRDKTWPIVQPCPCNSQACRPRHCYQTTTMFDVSFKANYHPATTTAVCTPCTNQFEWEVSIENVVFGTSTDQVTIPIRVPSFH